MTIAFEISGEPTVKTAKMTVEEAKDFVERCFTFCYEYCKVAEKGKSDEYFKIKNMVTESLIAWLSGQEN